MKGGQERNFPFLLLTYLVVSSVPYQGHMGGSPCE